jgi:hypothetical protein
MAKRHPWYLKLDKDVAELVHGHLPGRPTISERVGRGISGVTGMKSAAATDLFHLALVGTLAVWAAKTIASKQQRRPL